MTGPPDGGSRDQVYRHGADPDLVDFAFDARVVRVFPDMIRRSVPGHDDTIMLSGLIAGHVLAQLPPSRRCYDLGCSLGATLLAVARCTTATTPLVGIDNSAEMIDRASTELGAALPDRDLQLQHGDIRTAPLDEAGVVILNWTLQFVPPADRSMLIRRIATALPSGGALLLAEKVTGDDARDDALLDDLHLGFKRANGYSEMEIAGKRAALDRTLIRDSLATHRQRLADAGFERVLTYHRALNFAALLALKP